MEERVVRCIHPVLLSLLLCALFSSLNLVSSSAGITCRLHSACRVVRYLQRASIVQSDYHKGGDVSSAVALMLDFDETPDILLRGSEWADSELDDGIKLLSDNLWKLENFMSTIVRY